MNKLTTFFTLTVTITLGLPTLPAFAFTITQNNDNSQLLNTLLGNTTGFSNFSTNIIGDGRAFGLFENDPFDLGSGIVLSTGNVASLTQPNVSDGGFSPGVSVPLSFTKLAGEAGLPGGSGTGVFRADLSGIDFDLRSINFADSGSLFGGGIGAVSGFDLDAIKISNVLLNSAAEINNLPSLNVFDFSPFGTIFTPGSQRPPITSDDLFGTLNGNIDNAFATLEQFDVQFEKSSPNFGGAASLGDGGQVGFNLTETVSTDTPLYLYVGEGANNGESPDGLISVSNRLVSELNDLSTDFGLPGADNDSILMEIEFDADETAELLYFQFVFGSEEFVEFGGNEFNDLFSLKLNGFDFARLSNNSPVSINSLVPSPFSTDNPDFIYNPVDTGIASNQTKLDGYTVPITYAGLIEPNTRNTLTIEVKDVRDGLLDSAVFIRSGTLGSLDPDEIVEDSESIPEPTSIISFAILGIGFILKQKRIV